MRVKPVSGVVLAGGLGTRLAGEDKGLIDIGSRPMIAHVIERFAPQVTDLTINANRNVERYSAFGYPVVADTLAEYPGPLAGIGAALAACREQILACVPCDSPFLPTDLVDRLHEAMVREGSRVSYAVSGDQPQPVFALLHSDLLESLSDYVADGGRRIMSWYRQIDATPVDFGEDDSAFANINTAADIADAGRRLERP
jgi:molybdopterin-guanine dinucleotide biosynthesis protein A